MKNHIVLSVLPGHEQPGLPYWGDLVVDRSLATEKFIPEVSRLFQKYKLPVFYTTEYKPVGKSWTMEEIKSGLNRVYRVILQQNKNIPPGIIGDISILPYIHKVRQTDVGVSDLPQTSASLALKGIDPGQQIFLPQAHMLSKGSPNIKIAVLDTGIDINHPEISHSIQAGMDFVDIINGAGKFVGDYLGMDQDPHDEVGHGTHVCGILTAKGQKMATGVVPNCKIIPVRVLGAMKREEKVVGAGLIDNINNGIKWAVDHGADVINMSLGIKHTGGGLPHEEVIRYALQRGVTIVAASGNDGTEDRYYPSALPGVIAVGAVDQNDIIADFSTFGRHVSFVAPGAAIVSSYPDGKYSLSSGTSQASPFVAGGIALLKSFAQQLGNQLKDKQVKYILKHTADKLGTRLKDGKSGYGRVNLLDALKLLKYKMSTKLY